MGFFGGGGSSVDLASPPAIGNTTANTGRFTTVEATSRQFIMASSGALQVGLSGGDAQGTDSVTIQPNRTATNQVGYGSNSVAIGRTSRAGGNCTAVGSGATATGNNYDVAIGAGAVASGNVSMAIGLTTASEAQTVAIGYNGGVAVREGVVVGSNANGTAYLRGQFMMASPTSRAGANDASASFVFWRGSTTDATATEIFLSGQNNTRAILPANRMWACDLWISAVQSTSAKAFFSRQTVAIKRDGSNNTALVGSVQTIGANQNTGSPTWSIAITADDTNESLRVAVTGATSETVYWKVCGFISEVG
jgi:hypothetical protein